jgi:hypothetical protein
MEAFLNNLFGAAVSESRRLAAFVLPDRRARHFLSLGAAALHMQTEAVTKDVYFGIGLAGSRFGCRNKSEDIAAIPGLWADIDCAAPHRPGKPLPPSAEDAVALVELLPLAPSLLVHSGYGLHAYWLFKEPWVFESDAERVAAERMSKGWHGRICALADGFGWKLENLGDLARILRPPGTFNRKADPPVEVRVIEEHADRRYNPSDFEEFIDIAPPADSAPTPPAGALILRPDAEPPAEKFAALRETCPAFAQAWERRRTDLSDQSQSAYDLSLADIAALNGWADAEIANLLIAARRKHGQMPEKALRDDYVARTIAAARRMAAERAASAVDLSGLIVPKADDGPRSLRQLIRTYPALRPPVIDGLLAKAKR